MHSLHEAFLFYCSLSETLLLHDESYEPTWLMVMLKVARLVSFLMWSFINKPSTSVAIILNVIMVIIVFLSIERFSKNKRLFHKYVLSNPWQDDIR